MEAHHSSSEPVRLIDDVQSTLLWGKLAISHLDGGGDLLRLIIHQTLGRTVGDEREPTSTAPRFDVASLLSRGDIVADVTRWVFHTPGSVRREALCAGQLFIAHFLPECITVEKLSVVTIVGHETNLSGDQLIDVAVRRLNRAALRIEQRDDWVQTCQRWR